jgi:large subunit ribosomal protein L23
MMDPYRVIQAPIITEKGSAVTEKANQVVFRVDPCSGKIDIRRAVEALFRVRVRKVRTSHCSGKEKRVGKSVGRKANWKKAYVTLNPADKIDFFGST